VSQLLALSKDGQKLELAWVPLKAGKIDFKVTLTPPKNLKETNTQNNQVIKTIDVFVK
jgi:hypothetical protein